MGESRIILRGAYERAVLYVCIRIRIGMNGNAFVAIKIAGQNEHGDND